MTLLLSIQVVLLLSGILRYLIMKPLHGETISEFTFHATSNFWLVSHSPGHYNRTIGPLQPDYDDGSNKDKKTFRYTSLFLSHVCSYWDASNLAVSFSITLVVRATASSHEFADTIAYSTISISLTDANDNPPVFEPDPDRYVTSTFEEEDQGMFVIQVGCFRCVWK